jgi:type I restriction enzyme M protein
MTLTGVPRAACGVPPAGTADFAWVQHMVASMRPETGRVGVVMPHGVLSRGGTEKSIRQCLIEQDSLEAVIGLPLNLFYSTTIPACLLIFREAKPAGRLGKVLIVDGSGCFSKGRKQNQMSDNDIHAILAAYRGEPPKDVPVRLVNHGEIKDNGWDLNLGRYLRVAAVQAATVEESLARLAQTQSALRDAETNLSARLKAAGYV